MLQLDPVDGSSQLAAHGYNPETQTAQIQFRNGQIHEYEGVTPEDWGITELTVHMQAKHPGKGFQAYIKKNPQTGQGRLSRPLTATKPKSAMQEAPPATTNDLLERYIGLF